MKISLLILWTILLILNIYDVLTTFIILEHGGKEMNPMLNWLIINCGTCIGLFLPKLIAISFLTCITIWIIDQQINLRQKIVIHVSYILAICFNSYVMYNYNYVFIKVIM
jgi:hypothetical protein